MIAAAPALVEAYGVLTRLPAPHRLSPGHALALVDANFVRGARIVALDARSYRQLLQGAPGAGVSGGRTYDAVIAACAAKGGMASLLTFNDADFLSLGTRGVEIVVPSLR